MRYHNHLLDEPPSVFHRSLAEKIGLERAIVFQQLHFLIVAQENARNSYNYVDGHWWAYNTYKKWTESYFTWMSPRTCERVFTELEKLGIVISMQSVKSAMNREKWYTIDYDAWDILAETIESRWFDPPDPPEKPEEDQDDSAMRPNWPDASVQNGQTISPDWPDGSVQIGRNNMRPNWPVDLSNNIDIKIPNAGAHAHTHTHDPALVGGKPPERVKIRPTASGLRSAVRGDEDAGKTKVLSQLDMTIGNCYSPKPSFLNAAQKKQLKIQIERFESDELYRKYVNDRITEIKASLQGKAPFVKKVDFIGWLLDENQWTRYEREWRRAAPEDDHHGIDILD